MKLCNKYSFLLSVVLLACMFVACEKDASKTDFGSPLIYMPQAQSTGGANLNYAVPSGADSATYNYKIDNQNNKVNVLLGVTRSGLQNLDAYSVSISANTDTIVQMLAANVLNPATTMVLPANSYTLPQSISVSAGQSSASFYLSIDKAQLKTYTGKKLALGVVLSNPSKYSLNPSKNKVIVIIDVNSLNLQ